MAFLKKHSLWLFPILFFLAITPLLAHIDLAASMWSYTPLPKGIIDPSYNGFYSNEFWDFIYSFGFFPAQLVCAASGIVYLLSFKVDFWKKARRASLLSILTLILGGAIIGPLVKEAWSRPRPKQIAQFGGPKEFRPYWQPHFGPEIIPSKSFPSGHATCGFYFFWIYFVGRRLKSRKLAAFGLLTSFTSGAILSICRVLQGGHFVSDVLATALLMWEVAYFVDKLVYEWQPFSKRWYEAAHVSAA